MKNLLDVLERQINELHDELAWCDLVLRQLRHMPGAECEVELTKREVERMRDKLEEQLTVKLDVRDVLESFTYS
jgi:hypothetical protein